MNFSDLLTYIISIFIVISPFIFKNRLSKLELMGMVRSFGVFGTFLGILIGLMSFDTTDIEGSVPLLLMGLKTAFLTSIAGLLTSMVLQMHPKVYGFTQDSIKELDLDDLDNNEKVILLLGEIRKGILKDGQNEIATKLDSMISKIATTQNAITEQLAALKNSLTNVTTNDSQGSVAVNQTGGTNDKTLHEMLDQLKALRAGFIGLPEEVTENSQNKKSNNLSSNNVTQSMTHQLKELREQMVGTAKQNEKETSKSGLLVEISNNTNNTNTTTSMINESLRKLEEGQANLMQNVSYQLEKLVREIKKISVKPNNSGLTRNQQIALLLLIIGSVFLLFRKQLISGLRGEDYEEYSQY